MLGLGIATNITVLLGCIIREKLTMRHFQYANAVSTLDHNHIHQEKEAKNAIGHIIHSVAQVAGKFRRKIKMNADAGWCVFLQASMRGVQLYN